MKKTIQNIIIICETELTNVSRTIKQLNDDGWRVMQLIPEQHPRMGYVEFLALVERKELDE